jgi:hypothetical protein
MYHNGGNYTKFPVKTMAIKCTKLPYYIPNGHRLYQLFPFQDPSAFTQIGIFGLKIYHLANPDRRVGA